MKPHIARENIRGIREEVEEGGDVFRPFVEFWRGEHLVLAAHNTRQDMTHTAAAIQATIPLIEPTHIALCTDINMSGAINPSTGEMWEPGEMEEVRSKGLPAAAAVEDAIMLVVASPDDVVATLLPYSIIDGKCDWREERELTRGWENAGGRVIEVIRVAFHEASNHIRDSLLPSAADFGLSPKQAKVHLDAVAIKLLLSSGEHHVIVGATGDPEWDETLVASLENGPSPEFLRELGGGSWN